MALDQFEEIAAVLYESGKRDAAAAGKIAMWVWAAQRVMDYACALDCLKVIEFIRRHKVDDREG